MLPVQCSTDWPNELSSTTSGEDVVIAVKEGLDDKKIQSLTPIK